MPRKKPSGQSLPFVTPTIHEGPSPGQVRRDLQRRARTAQRRTAATTYQAQVVLPPPVKRSTGPRVSCANTACTFGGMPRAILHPTGLCEVCCTRFGDLGCAACAWDE